MNYAQRFSQLDALLVKHAWLWRPQPYKQIRPDWCERLPQLCSQLLSLDDGQLNRLSNDDTLLTTYLSGHVPALAALEDLTRLPERAPSPLNDLGPHFPNGIPGRKWRQIGAFTSALGKIHSPVLDWCGGKGHLGRLLAVQWQQPVLTLDYNPKLCKEGQHLARRVHAEQVFHNGDALSSSACEVLTGRHAVALHACGELHRTLVRHTASSGITALDFAPCCYHRYGGTHYSPLSPSAKLTLTDEDMRLAVTETVTAVDREVRRRDQEMAWKLGFDQLRRDIGNSDTYHPLKPIDKSWLHFDFKDFCSALAEREGLFFHPGIDWQEYEAIGWRRQHDTMRLSLVRHAFRRAIEIWLVLDLVNYLHQQGYSVELGTFCEPELTPRNILVSARLQSAKENDQLTACPV